MPKYTRFLVLLVLALLLSASLASADIIQTLTFSVDTQCPPASCNLLTGYLGSPASGGGDFSSIGDPWAYSFTTGNALSWCSYGCGVLYEASFGYGGSIQINGPDGLTFTGAVTSGSAFVPGELASLSVDYFGQWSNGLYGYGTISTSSDSAYNFFLDHFDSNIAPEPSSLMLLGTGVAGLWSLSRRRLRR